MRSIPRAAVPLALAAGLVAAAPAAADAKPAPRPARRAAPTVELIYPSVVQVRIGRAERALERATKRIESGEVDKAALSLKVVRRQTAAAWRGAKYVIRTAPPPVPPEDLRVRAPARARTTRSARPTPRRRRPGSRCSRSSTTWPRRSCS